MKKYKVLFMMVVSLSFMSFFGFANEGKGITPPAVSVKDGYIRETIPGTVISSAYMTIINHSNKPIELIGASSEFSPRVEIHEHSMADGMMRMRQLNSIIIDANSSVKLQPYGLHLMLFDIEKPLKHNESAKIILQFTSQPELSITLPIQSIKQKSHH